jgi:hypothetical protein
MRIRSAALLAAGGALAAYALLRPRMKNWGASDSEQSMSLPGDDLITGASTTGTMATTIDAPPEIVWAWLAQMGCDRAGFYSWDRLDNGGRASADRIHPEWQDLKEGDRVLSAPDGSHWFDVALLEPQRTLVLRASLSVPTAHQFAPRLGFPRAYSDGTWTFHLRSIGDGGTRVIVRGSWSGRPRWLLRLGNWLVWDPAHWVMQRKQFSELRRRVGSASGASSVGSRSVSQTVSPT